MVNADFILPGTGSGKTFVFVSGYSLNLYLTYVKNGVISDTKNLYFYGENNAEFHGISVSASDPNWVINASKKVSAIYKRHSASEATYSIYEPGANIQNYRYDALDIALTVFL